MLISAIVTRRLKEGKTYEDFRHAWYHTTGFGIKEGNEGMQFYTVINCFDPQEITVVSIFKTTAEKLKAALKIEVKERLKNPLDDVIEPQIDRKFGLIISEDDFSASGDIAYKEPTIDGKPVDMKAFTDDLKILASLYKNASDERDQLKEKQKSP